MAICLPHSQRAFLLSLAPSPGNTLNAIPLTNIPVISVASLRATRDNVWDLLIVKPDHELAILTHGTRELPIQLCHPQKSSSGVGDNDMQVDSNLPISVDHGPIVSVHSDHFSTILVTFQDGWKERATIDLVPHDLLVSQCMQVLSLILPSDYMFALHTMFLQRWSESGRPTANDADFAHFSDTISSCFLLPCGAGARPADERPWTMLGLSPSHDRFIDDLALRGLEMPSKALYKNTAISLVEKRKPHFLMGPALWALHTLGENLRLMIDQYQSLIRLVPLICGVAQAVRPEWVDYWKRLCPDAAPSWPSPATTGWLLPRHVCSFS